ncbi:hypothetical protein ERO13_D09G067700v2 [Gossypium hirsutum]|uniref:Solanesyl diphosphate synthase 1, chloroplastic n=1 Tax=Gossypium hirsutum TaxID=3635 RepID=A0A1U8I1X3_GOSHI|nr:solanesyl diphosphate synthase 1, chloroplastic-like [Gossypium hirsutum]XP_040956286.1 solanesyl diphosphate synthase 1, chloroplastic-like [Gossypium hirsutum]KAG4129252.1 hypothetical protein ERO13_D09G067700v2 [Gossypium hirsutum]KAG4129253.1 hypothetical protein ERO13_D09G067700v2 [Gossypium hirsutum]KAG4129254.1 hypothetical protein ERO13_D09G067700v2 [Gossypium hirsutum]
MVKPKPIRQIMTDREKHKLSLELESLLGELPENIVDFLKEQSSSDGQMGEDEIEIDIDALSHETLYKLHKLLDDYLLEKQKNQAKAESCKMELINESGLSNSSMQPYKASTKGAVIFSRADHSVTEKMYEYGKNLGLSFQVVDDILDFTQSAEQLGKLASSDLAKGNLTAPVIFALEKEPKLRDIIESEFCETGSLNEAIELVKQCGGIERAQKLAKEKADIAIKSLQCLPQSDFRLGLEDMVMFNLERID